MNEKEVMSRLADATKAGAMPASHGRTAHLESRPPDERIAPTLLLWWIGEADPICQVPGEGGNGILIQIGGGPRLAINRVATRQREGLDVCAYDVHERNRKELGTRKRSRRRAVES
jgi:hypothetical protein